MTDHVARNELSIETTSPAPAYPARRFYRAYAPEDDQAVAAIRTKYGLHSDEDAIRMALRMVAGDAIKITTPPAPAGRKLVVKFRLKPTG